METRPTADGRDAWMFNPFVRREPSPPEPDPSEVLACASQDLVEEFGERFLSLLQVGLPDQAASTAIGF